MKQPSENDIMPKSATDALIWIPEWNAYENGKALRTLYRVIRYDQRGFGDSGLITKREPYSDRQDLYALMKFLGIDGEGAGGASSVPLRRDDAVQTACGCGAAAVPS